MSEEMQDFIAEVEKYPCLWDLNNENYQNQTQRDLAWEEICASVIDDWGDLSPQEKTILSDNKKKQWNNIRDGYRKYLNRTKDTPTGSRARARRKYIYADNLHFLTHILQTSRQRKENYKNNDNEIIIIKEEQEQNDVERNRRKSLRRQEDSTERQVKKRKTNNEEDLPNQILNIFKEKEKKNNEPSYYHDEDSQFLLSFRNDLKEMSRSQKLEFKLGMVKLIQNIIEKTE